MNLLWLRILNTLILIGPTWQKFAAFACFRAGFFILRFVTNGVKKPQREWGVVAIFQSLCKKAWIQSNNQNKFCTASSCCPASQLLRSALLELLPRRVVVKTQEVGEMGPV